jgi:hypothetical protein
MLIIPVLQVAFLFLARDEIHTEPIWTAFFAAAAELSLQKRVPATNPLHHHVLPTQFPEVICEARQHFDLEQLKKWEEGVYR